MKPGLTIEIRDAHGNVVARDWDKPIAAPAPVDMTPMANMALRDGVTFHRQPCGSYVATAGAKRVCGSSIESGPWASPKDTDERSRELVASVMIAWLTWERRGRPT
jgi:hypothetical protein